MRIQLASYSGLTREQLMQYGWISGDQNPIHFDREVAVRRGLPKLIVHGMYLYCLVYKSVEDYLRGRGLPLRIAELSAKFSGMTFEGDAFSIEMDLPDSEQPISSGSLCRIQLLSASGEVNGTYQARFISNAKP